MGYYFSAKQIGGYSFQQRNFCKRLIAKPARSYFSYAKGVGLGEIIASEEWSVGGGSKIFHHRQRQVELTDRLRQGSFKARCEVVRDLSALGWDKPLGDGNATLLRSAHHALDEEWAMAAGVSLREATLEVQALLQEGKQLYKK